MLLQPLVAAVPTSCMFLCTSPSQHSILLFLLLFFFSFCRHTSLFPDISMFYLLHLPALSGPQFHSVYQPPFSILLFFSSVFFCLAVSPILPPSQPYNSRSFPFLSFSYSPLLFLTPRFLFSLCTGWVIKD